VQARRVNIGRVRARLQPNNPLSILGYTIMTQLPKTLHECNQGSHGAGLVIIQALTSRALGLLQGAS